MYPIAAGYGSKCTSQYSPSDSLLTELESRKRKAGTAGNWKNNRCARSGKPAERNCGDSNKGPESYVRMELSGNFRQTGKKLHLPVSEKLPHLLKRRRL